MEDRESLKAAVTEAIKEAMKESQMIVCKRYDAHHRWIEQEIERRRKREERWAQIRIQILGGLGLSIITGTLYLVGLGVKYIFNTFANHG